MPRSVIGAVIKIGKRVLKNWATVSIAVLAFITIFFFEVDFFVIIVFAGLAGFIGGKIWKEKFQIMTKKEENLISIIARVLLLLKLFRPHYPVLSKRHQFF